ncbi:MAG TPA: hypothetical protein VMX97_14040 [Hyphomicrobiaceae bacterium]|nr:hypothetical protein [Hyphomicrobiaceae bacterium]
MSQSSRLPSVVLTSCIGAALAGYIYISPALAGSSSKDPLRCTSETSLPQLPGIRFTNPSTLEPRDTLTASDEIAAMEAIQIALSEVADGATYVWHREHGRLSAIVRPTTSFRNARGGVCRHIKIMLNSGTYSRHSEGIACRQVSGIWSLEG